ncbi:MAG TPA: hypothetical protein DCG28_04035 [Lachnospiraceae bacterium]|nr:hypothetical protein [Lachnospiraceae bacterium]
MDASTLKIIFLCCIFFLYIWEKYKQKEEKADSAADSDLTQFSEEERAMLKSLDGEKNKDLKMAAMIALAAKDEGITRYADNPYIQNNNKIITDRMHILTPTFNVKMFLDFAKDVFYKASKGMQMGNIIAKDVDLSVLPGSVERFSVCFLNNYRADNAKEWLKALITVEEGSKEEKFFLTFGRTNPLLTTTDGELLTLKCPYCGGVVEFKKVTAVCPYCKNTVTFAEYDWKLERLEKIDDETLISNKAIKMSKE